MYPSLASLPLSRASAPVSKGREDLLDDDDRARQQKNWEEKQAEFHKTIHAKEAAEAKAEAEKEAAKQAKEEKEARERAEKLKAESTTKKEDEDDDYPKEMRYD